MLTIRWASDPADRQHLGQLAEVLSGSGEEELIFGAVGASEAEAIQLEDALEVREQHLNLLPPLREVA